VQLVSETPAGNEASGALVQDIGAYIAQAIASDVRDALGDPAVALIERAAERATARIVARIATPARSYLTLVS
jgi:hypothetical protein